MGNDELAWSFKVKKDFRKGIDNGQIDGWKMDG